MVNYQKTSSFDHNNGLFCREMSRPKKDLPSYLKHAPSGSARCVWEGKTVYLGKYGSPESYAEYQKILALFLATGSITYKRDRFNILQAVQSFLDLIDREYPATSGEPRNIRIGLTDLVSKFGPLPINEFRPIDFSYIIQGWIDRGLSKSTIVKYHWYLLRLFKHAAKLELCDLEVYQKLQTVETVRKRRSQAREPDPIKPVTREQIEKVLPFLNVQIRGLVELQWLTGMRPGEACRIQWNEIDQAREVWLYRPEKHKKKHRGKGRTIGIGPRGQAVLRAFEDRPKDQPIFSPREAMASYQAERALKRVTPLPKQQAEKVEKVPKKQPGEGYSVSGYSHAILKACRKAGVEPWSPNQIRHSFASEIRKQIGIEHAQVALGHDHLKTTEIYAEVDLEKVVEVAKKLG